MTALTCRYRVKRRLYVTSQFGKPFANVLDDLRLLFIVDVDVGLQSLQLLIHADGVGLGRLKEPDQSRSVFDSLADLVGLPRIGEFFQQPGVVHLWPNVVDKRPCLAVCFAFWIPLLVEIDQMRLQAVF